ncbi:MAG: hypothetical protein A2787_02895 [Omnitrophica WOR_2 bacterium RIFCSPHIGHO2_01_FULL_48_9]|nr:MAG: hypothetical protein A3D10_00770 [Omnitrophica WOR_2 bacterium RIFCSPHIGHO2_02_FULL_48_11]OGX33706.1 MAG: hypothetical protein A2787_02895 [Omnitrophica WOR_2 bacterium RIFCSPHIGHO2_01_FULL_48_9]
MATIHITDLHLRAIIGTNNWERKKEQDILINIAIDYNAEPASRSDKLKDTVDYKTLTKAIIKHVESSKYYLLEKLTAKILDIVLKTRGVEAATVRIDKPQALRFAESVSVTLTAQRP